MHIVYKKSLSFLTSARRRPNNKKDYFLTSQFEIELFLCEVFPLESKKAENLNKKFLLINSGKG